MPRNAKDSDDEIEPKSGRRTRAALNPSVLDSPLRRSTRIKQPVQQDGSSPDSLSDVSSTGTARSNRRKTTTGDAEPARNTRTRRTSIASDVSELTETESLPDGPPKRVTRRSVASVAAVDTPPGLNGRTRRATRAGSESKSTPPVGRITRRNRASSLEPEAMEEQVVREVGTPVKSRRRASALPSEPAVAEESEDSGRASRRTSTKTVYEVDEDSPESPVLNTSKSSRRKSKNDVNEFVEKMEIDENSVGESEANTIERSTRENTEAAADVSHVAHKLEGSIKLTDSSEPKKADDGSSHQFSSPSRGSSYTVESLLSPSTEKPEKNPGNKENEILNDSAALLEKSGRLSNRSDVRFSNRNSLGSSYVKPQEKRLNVSVDDSLLSNDYETPTKTQENVNTELSKRSSRKERYSVDECVVIIEPMEMDRVDKIVSTKKVDTPESPKIRKTYQIEEITSEEMENKEPEYILPDKDVKNTDNFIISENVSDRETNFEISNVVSIAADEKDEKMYEEEPMDVDESPDTFYLELKDTGEANEEQTGNEGVNNEEITVETSSMNTESRTSISEDKATTDVADNDKSSTEISISHPEPQVLDSNEKVSIDCAKDEKTSSEPSVSNDELRVLNPEEKAQKVDENDGKSSSEHSVSNSEEKSLSDNGNDEETSSEQLILDAEKLALNSKEQTLSDRPNDGTTSSEHSISNTETLASNSEEKTPSDVANDEKASAEPANPSIELTASDSSTNNGKPVNSAEIEDNLVCAKDRNPSIVTESSTAGANDEEASNVSEEKSRESTSNANEDENKNEEIEEKSAEKEVEGKTAHQSDDESEYDGYPEFKDIPAEEWTGADAEKNTKNTDMDSNSVHSVSTERNGSEFDFVLVDKEFSQVSEKEDQAKSDYDSDDTLKIAVASEESVESKDDEKHVNTSAANEETPMDVSSDEEETDIKANNSVSMKNKSFDTSPKMIEAKTPNKNISLIADTSAKGSSIGLNSSRRKSLLSVDDQSNENSNSSTKMNRSVRNSLQKNILNANASSEEENNSDNSGETDSPEVVKTPKTIDRKSLDASAKKSKNTPDSTRTIGSAKNTPSNAETKANETSAKRNRSLTKSATSSPSDDAENSSDITTESESTVKENESEKVSKVALKKQLYAGSPANKSLNKSVKIGSAKKSASNKNSSESEAFSSDSSEESQEDVSSPKDALNESRKSVSGKESKIDKNKWIMTPYSVKVIKSNVDSPASPEPGDKGLDKFAKLKKPIKIPLNQSSENALRACADSPTSPDPKDKGLDISAKSRSAKKSTNKNTWSSAIDSESEIDNQDAQEKLNKSGKIGSAKKSANSSRSSAISSDSVADDEDSQENFNRSQKSASSKKSAIDKNYSTIAQVNSDSDVDEDVKSDTTDDDADISRKIPAYLFDYSSESNSCISAKSIDSDVERDMNLHGKSVLEYSDDDVPADDCMATESESSDDDDDGADLADFVVDDDDDEEEDYSDVEHDLGLDDNESQESLTSEEKKPRKRIIPRPARDSDSTDSEEEPPTNVSSRLDKSNTPKTPIKPAKLNKTQEILESEAKPVDLNVSAKNIASKNKNQLIQCSTPKTVARQSLLLEQSDSTKATTPLNESLKKADSSIKLNVSTAKKLSKSVCETTETPAKLSSSFKITKTPKASLQVQEQLQISLPADLNETADRTNLSKVKSTKLSTLNQTVVPPGSESPETRFLMKQKLNDSLPALKLQQRAKALRRSVLDNLREGIQVTEQVPEEAEEIQEDVAENETSPSKKETASEHEVSSEKKKKKKKKSTSENPEEIATSLIESVTEVNDDLNASAKKAKKLKKKKPAETPEQEEVKSEEKIPKKKKKKLEKVVEDVVSDEVDKKGKKKKKKDEAMMENIISDESDKKDKKKKQKKHEEVIEKIVLDEVEDKKKKKSKKARKIEETTEPEVPVSRQKSRRIGAQTNQDSDSEEPEAIDFAMARDAALRDFKKITESIKAGQEAKKKKHQENLTSKQERRAKTQPEVPVTFEKMKTSVKRLPDDVLENLSHVAERPKKRRKVNEEPSKTTLAPFQTKSGNFKVDDGYIPLSSNGGTTQFSVVNLKKAVKHSKKAVAASTFRERMLARNPREPVSAYLMYQQKQKHSAGADRIY